MEVIEKTIIDCLFLPDDTEVSLIPPPYWSLDLRRPLPGLEEFPGGGRLSAISTLVRRGVSCLPPVEISERALVASRGLG